MEVLCHWGTEKTSFETKIVPQKINAYILGVVGSILVCGLDIQGGDEHLKSTWRIIMSRKWKTIFHSNPQIKKHARACEVSSPWGSSWCGTGTTDSTSLFPVFTLSILVGGLSSFEFVEVRQEWADLQGKANCELRVTVRQAGTSPAGCSLTEPEQEQSRSGGASQGQPQPLDKSTGMRQARGQARKLIQQVRGRGSEVQGPSQHPYSAGKCRSQARTLRVHEWRLFAALSLNLAQVSSRVMQRHRIRADLKHKQLNL